MPMPKLSLKKKNKNVRRSKSAKGGKRGKSKRTKKNKGHPPPKPCSEAECFNNPNCGPEC